MNADSDIFCEFPNWLWAEVVVEEPAGHIEI